MTFQNAAIKTYKEVFNLCVGGSIQGAVDSVMPVPAACAKVNTLCSTFQVFVPFSVLKQSNLLARVHHSFSLNFPLKLGAFQLVKLKQL
jgi:hypothetical protein